MGKDTLTQQDKQKLKELFTRAQKNNSVMWQTVFSFDNRWLQQNGLYNPLTRQVDARKLKEYTRAAMDKLTEKEALKGSAVWSAAIHYNTEHIHIHIAMVELSPHGPLRSSTVMRNTKAGLGKAPLTPLKAPQLTGY